MFWVGTRYKLLLFVSRQAYLPFASIKHAPEVFIQGKSSFPRVLATALTFSLAVIVAVCW